MNEYIIEQIATICDLCANWIINDDPSGVDYFEPEVAQARWDAMQAGLPSLLESLGLERLVGGKHKRLYSHTVKCECCDAWTLDTYLMDGVYVEEDDGPCVHAANYDTWEMYGDGPY